MKRRIWVGGAVGLIASAVAVSVAAAAPSASTTTLEPAPQIGMDQGLLKTTAYEQALATAFNSTSQEVVSAPPSN